MIAFGSGAIEPAIGNFRVEVNHFRNHAFPSAVMGPC